MKVYFIILLLIGMSVIPVVSQPIQSHRYEIEQDKRDDYANILPVENRGVIIFRDTDDFDEGDVWQFIALDTALTEKWEKKISIDTRYILKGYEINDAKLHLLYREGEYEKKDYHLISLSFEEGEIQRYDIENEIALELSHISMLQSGMVLGGYINRSPSLVLYQFDDQSFEVVPGFFKDRSNIVDLRDNENGTFNVVTIENSYEGDLLRLRTHSYDGDLLFEREIKPKDKINIQSAQSSGFIDGNVVIGGTYGVKNSRYASGFYISIVKPTGQNNTIKYHNFYALEHFFDYMNPKRAARLRIRMQNKSESGKEVNFPSRILFNDIINTDRGYLLHAELYNPNFNNNSLVGYGYLTPEQGFRRRSLASQRYAQQTSPLQHVDEADSFEYLESIVFETDKQGNIIWDNSMPIDDLELPELTQISQRGVNDLGTLLLYRQEEDINFRIMKESELIEENSFTISLLDEYDKVLNSIDFRGGAYHWYESTFFIWGYQKVENKVKAAKEDIPKNRDVLYVNKIEFK